MTLNMKFPQISGIHVHQYPSGKWGFVGRVPVALSYRCSPEDAAVIASSGPSIARDIALANGREFVTLTHPTKEAAETALAEWVQANAAVAS